MRTEIRMIGAERIAGGHGVRSALVWMDEAERYVINSKGGAMAEDRRLLVTVATWPWYLPFRKKKEVG